MKQTHRSFTNFTVFACLLLILVAIILKLFLDDATWHVLMAIVCLSGSLLAVSDLFGKSSDDQRNMHTLSLSILNPIYNEFADRSLFSDTNGKDLRKQRYSGESDFERSLRNIDDARDRAVRELIWERRNNEKRPGRARTNRLVRIVFLILSALVLVGGTVLLFVFPQYFPELSSYGVEAIIIGSLVLVLATAFSSGSNYAYLQRIEMLLGLRERCENIISHPKPVPEFRPIYQDSPKKPETVTPSPAPAPVDAVSAASPFTPAQPTSEEAPEALSGASDVPSVIWQSESDSDIPET